MICYRPNQGLPNRRFDFEKGRQLYPRAQPNAFRRFTSRPRLRRAAPFLNS